MRSDIHNFIRGKWAVAGLLWLLMWLLAGVLEKVDSSQTWG